MTQPPPVTAITAISWSPSRSGLLATIGKESPIVQLYDIQHTSVGTDDSVFSSYVYGLQLKGMSRSMIFCCGKDCMYFYFDCAVVRALACWRGSPLGLGPAGSQQIVTPVHTFVGARMEQSVSVRPWCKRSRVRSPDLTSLFQLLSFQCSLK